MGQVQVASIANFGVNHRPARRLELLHMQTHEISMLHCVTQLSQPQRIPPRPTSDVGDYRRRGRKPLPQNLLGALKLECTFRIAQPVPLLALRVMRLHLGILRAHGVSLSETEEDRETVLLRPSS